MEYNPWIYRRQLGRVRVMDGRERLAWNLRTLRTEKGITQEMLAVDADVDTSYISRIESGRINPSIDIIERLAAALSVDLVDLLLQPPGRAKPPSTISPGRKAKR